MGDFYICKNCGAQYGETAGYPAECKICSDERQYVPSGGQEWTTLGELLEGGYRNVFKEVEPGLFSIKTEPQVGIGQNAYLVTMEEGNFLWDCITFLDEDTKQAINALGGIQGIVLSHPHYYSTIVEWAEAFGCPIYIHEADREWVVRDSDKYVFWQGERLELAPGVTAIHLGGHFDGSSVLLWQKGAEGKGALLIGDTLFIVPDQGWLSFLYSHPNRIPLPAFEVRKIAEILEGYEFERLYGAFDNAIMAGGKEAVRKSAARYLWHVERTEINVKEGKVI